MHPNFWNQSFNSRKVSRVPATNKQNQQIGKYYLQCQGVLLFCLKIQDETVDFVRIFGKQINSKI